MKLRELKPGSVAIIADVHGNAEIRKKLLDMGLIKGVEVKVVRNAPLKDPMEIEVRGYNLSIRKVDAENISVEVKQ